jgi:hypothetical protein
MDATPRRTPRPSRFWTTKALLLATWGAVSGAWAQWICRCAVAYFLRGGGTLVANAVAVALVGSALLAFHIAWRIDRRAEQDGRSGIMMVAFALGCVAGIESLPMPR